MEERSPHSVVIRPPTADPDTGNLSDMGEMGYPEPMGHTFHRKTKLLGKLFEQNATLVAYVDGANTIAPANGDDFCRPIGSPDQMMNLPDLVVWGTGSIVL